MSEVAVKALSAEARSILTAWLESGRRIAGDFREGRAPDLREAADWLEHAIASSSVAPSVPPDIQGEPVAWLHEPTGTVLDAAQLREKLPLWKNQFSELGDIAADFVPLYRTPTAPAPDAAVEALTWPEPKRINPDIGERTGVPYLDCLLDRLLDAQQDVNLHANETMSQSLADAAAIIDEVETAIRKLAPRAALSSSPALPGVGGVDLLAPFEKNRSLELSWGPVDDDEGSPCAWRIHEQWGNVNDREWRLRATGDTPAEAIRSYIANPAKP